MRTFFAVVYLFVVGLLTNIGLYLHWGLPVTEQAVALICFCGAVIGIERLLTIFGVVKW